MEVVSDASEQVGEGEGSAGEDENISAISASRRREQRQDLAIELDEALRGKTAVWPGCRHDEKDGGREEDDETQEGRRQPDGQMRTSSPPSTEVTPIPQMRAMLIQALSWLFSSSPVMLESQPHRAVDESIAAPAPSTIAAVRTARWSRFRMATMTMMASIAAKKVAYKRRLNAHPEWARGARRGNWARGQPPS